MKIKCVHGYFEFEESNVGEVSDFISMFGLPLVRVGDRFTFEDLAEAPNFSIEGKEYLTGIATADFAGERGEVFKANGFVYDWDKGLIVPINQITQVVTIYQAGRFFTTLHGLLKPGSVTQKGDRVESYMAWYSNDRNRFRYSEITYVE